MGMIWVYICYGGGEMGMEVLYEMLMVWYGDNCIISLQ